MEEPIISEQEVAFVSRMVTLLKEDILPPLISQARRTDKLLRMWVLEDSSMQIGPLITLLLASLLGQDLSSFRLKIFVTYQDEEALERARQCAVGSSILASLAFSNLSPGDEPATNQESLTASLRPLLIFGKHDCWHDPFFARLDLIVCGFSLQHHSLERRLRFLAQMQTSLRPGGYVCLSEPDEISLRALGYHRIAAALPLYRYDREPTPTRVVIEAEAHSHPAEGEAAERLRRLLATTPGASSLPEEQGLELDRAARSSMSLTLDGLLRLAPMGMVVIDHHFQILSFNRAAYKLLGLQLHEEHASDFFHATRGLPYHEVRTAIETVLREGTGQTLPQVELSAGNGGNGRILSITICSLPTEIGIQSNVVLYILDVTEQIVQQHLQHRQALEHAQLTQQYQELSRTCERLHENSTHLLLDYQRLALQHERTQESHRHLEQQVEQLQEEITVLMEEQGSERS